MPTLPPSIQRSLSMLLAGVLLALTLCGCLGREPTPQLLNLVDVAPRVVSPGQSIEITGNGFPLEKRARLSFRGTLYRPGEAPRKVSGLELNAKSTSATKIVAKFPPSAMEQFCGSGADSKHTTFVGEVLVSFPAITPGSLPITGTLTDITVDMRGKYMRKARFEALSKEGKRALAYVGLKVNADISAAGGLLVTAVAPGSSAQTAGIGPGDVLLGLNGLTLLDLTDVAPTGRERFVTFRVHAKGQERPWNKLVGIQGYKPSGATDLLGVGIIVGVAAMLVLFFLSPASSALTWMERTLRKRAGLSGARGKQLPAWVLQRAFYRLGTEVRGWRGALTLSVCTLVSALFACLPFVETLYPGGSTSATFGLVILLGLCTVVLGFMASPVEKFSFKGMFKKAGSLLSLQLPAALSVLGLVVLSSALRVQDLVRAQGAYPWNWLSFRTPAGLLFAIGICLPAWLVAKPSMQKLPEVEAPAVGEGMLAKQASPGVAARICDLAAVFGIAACAVALAFGGWRLPFVDAARQERQMSLLAAGAAFYLLKSWGLVLAIKASQSLLPRLGLHEMAGVVWRRVLPATVLALGLGAGWIHWDPPAIVRRALAGIIVGGVLVLFVYYLRRLTQSFARTRPVAQVSPFI